MTQIGAQLYVNKDRPKTEVLLRNVEKQGFKATMLTVDAAVPGKRELDQRAKGDFKVGADSAEACRAEAELYHCAGHAGDQWLVRNWQWSWCRTCRPFGAHSLNIHLTPLHRLSRGTRTQTLSVSY